MKRKERWYLSFYKYHTRNNELSNVEKAEEAGRRYVDSYLSYVIGGAVFTVTNLWLLGLVASVSSKLVLSEGKIRYQKYRSLQEVINSNESVIKNLKKAYGI